VLTASRYESADRVRARREELGLSRLALARRVARSVHTIEAWEKGARRPSHYALIALAEALKVDAAEILL
jgi:transcriptional regulator with XRE-family HTH domain